MTSGGWIESAGWVGTTPIFRPALVEVSKRREMLNIAAVTQNAVS